MKRLWISLFLVLSIAAVVFWRVQKAPATAPGSKAKAGVAAVPVHTVVTTQSQVPIWLSGLGTVQASNTVTVRPRVEGELTKVHFVEGQFVKTGDILAEIDPRRYQATLAQAIAKRSQDEALLLNARRELGRLRALVASEAETRRMLDAQETAVIQYEAALKADQAAIDSAQLDLDFTLIRAPIDGVTGVRLIDAGNLVTASQGPGLVVLTQMQPISVMFMLPQQNLGRLLQSLRANQSQALRVQAVTHTGEVLGEGSLQLVDNQIDTSTGTLRLKAAFPNEERLLWPGQFVNARVLVDTLRQAITVPSECIQPGLEGSFVYVVKSDQTVEARYVKTDVTVDGQTVILDGLQAGERVVRDGQNKLKPGARITESTQQVSQAS